MAGTRLCVGSTHVLAWMLPKLPSLVSSPLSTQCVPVVTMNNVATACV